MYKFIFIFGYTGRLIYWSIYTASDTNAYSFFFDQIWREVFQYLYITDDPPDASVPAVDICSLRSAAGMTRSANVTR